MRLLPLLVLLCAACATPRNPNREAVSWEQRGAEVTITRDDWGIPHVHGKTDADAVFGLMYAQAEDDYPRVERNYLKSLGRLAEAEGEGAIFSDLRMRLYVDPEEMQQRYHGSPAWLQALMNAWADGLN
jgi:acyl-homoserine-lactone acylase